MIKTTRTFMMLAGAAIALSACKTNETAQTTLSGLDPQNFVAEYEGKPTALYTLKNANGMEVCVTNFGGRIVSVMVPDRNGDFKDVVLGFDSVQVISLKTISVISARP